MRIHFFLPGFLITFVLFMQGAQVAHAADSTFNADTVLSGNWDSFTAVTALDGSAADELIVADNTIIVTVPGGSTFTLKASANITFANDGGIATTCGVTPTLTVTGPKNNLVITPTNSPCPASGSSQPSNRRIDNIAASVALTVSLGDHRDRALLRLVNQLMSAERLIPGRVTLAEQLVTAAGKTTLSSLSDLLGNDSLKTLLLQLFSQDSALSDLMRGQRSERLVLEVWHPGEACAAGNNPLASTTFSINLFGHGITSLPALAAGTYDFSIRKPYGLCQIRTGQTLAASMALDFPGYVHVGDLNMNGKVDAGDFQIFLQNLGATQYDFNEDGRIDLNDVTDFLEGLRVAL